jgi:hypothetical protein
MKLVLAAAALVTLFLLPGPVLACSCAGTPSVCGAFASADAVFVGTVMRVENRYPHSVTVRETDDSRTPSIF